LTAGNYPGIIAKPTLTEFRTGPHADEEVLPSSWRATQIKSTRLH
jgi:hypothetical protein